MLETGGDWIDHATSRSPEQEKMWNTTIDTSANISEAEQPRFLSTFRPVAENSAMQPMAEAATLTSGFGWFVSWISSVVSLDVCPAEPRLYQQMVDLQEQILRKLE